MKNFKKKYRVEDVNFDAKKDGRNRRIAKHMTKHRRHNGESSGVFLPQWRMRQIRWMDSVQRSWFKRKGQAVTGGRAFSCGCGLISCEGHILLQSKKQ